MSESGRARTEPEAGGDERVTLHASPEAALRENLLAGTGAKIGRFVVLRELGRGGMGVVFAAYDEELDRKVAIKLLRATLREGSTGRGRLLREAMALARLSHPNVVTIYEVGEFEGQVFLAMEFVQGPTLERWLRDAPRSLEAVLRVFGEAGRGLAAAHRAEILHRDFKPANVLLGDDGRVRVADFGLAQAQDRRSQELERAAGSTGEGVAWSGGQDAMTAPLTVVGTLIGTPSYMPPERFITGAPSDARADQFSFCVALYEALYGSRPFRGETLEALREAVLLGAIVPAPREAKVPGWLRKVLLRGLAREPAQRFPSILELLAALERDPVRARRRIAAVVGGAALLVAGGYGLAVAGGSSPEPTCEDARPSLAPLWDERREEVRRSLLATKVVFAADTWDRVSGRLDRHADAWARIHGEACVAHKRGEQSDALLDLRMTCLQRRRGELAALVDRLAHADAETAVEAVAAVDGLTPLARCSDAAALQAAIPPPDDPAAAARVGALRDRLAEARAAGLTRKIADGQAIVGEVITAAQAMAYKPLLAEALAVRGTIEDFGGEYAKASETLTAALWLADVVRDDVLLATVMSRLVTVLGSRLVRPEEALRWRPHADAVVQRVGEASESDVRLMQAFASALVSQRRGSEAIPLLERALALAEKLYGADDARVIGAVDNLGGAYLFAGDALKAQALYRRALELAERTYGPQHPAVAGYAFNLGSAHAMVGGLAEAQPLFERALAIREAVLGPEHPDLATSLDNLGAVLSMRGEPRRARELLGRALAIAERNFGREHPSLGETLFNLALLDAELGDRASARALLQRCLAIREATRTKDHPQLAETLVELGTLDVADGHAAAGVATIERALGILERTKEGYLPDLEPFVRFRLAKALHAAGQERRAREIAVEVLATYERLKASGELAAERFDLLRAEIDEFMAQGR